MRKLSIALVGAAAALMGLSGTQAQTQSRFPEKAVKIVVPFPAGGTADLLPRIVGEKLSAKWDVPVVVENRSGAGGNIGADAVARADPDGYTLLASPPGPLAINHNLYAKLSYDPTGFVPITILATVPNVLAARTGLPAASVKDVIALAKASPGKLTFASQGNGSTSHLTASLFESMAGVKMLHIPYKGTAPALTDLLGGRVDIFFDNLGSTLRHHEAGKIKILAVASPKRAPALPKVPTVAESGLPQFASVTWFGVIAPKGTPAPVARQLNAAFVEALRLPDVQKRFLEVGAEPLGEGPRETAAFIKEEMERWNKVIKSADVRLN
jgi:tripartite-type tricarboxylate transporter receptor subunit TctC